MCSATAIPVKFRQLRYFTGLIDGRDPVLEKCVGSLKFVSHTTIMDSVSTSGLNPVAGPLILKLFVEEFDTIVIFKASNLAITLTTKEGRNGVANNCRIYCDGVRRRPPSSCFERGIW